MLKCKHCRGTEFGVTLIETRITPVKMVDGVAVGMLAEPQVEQRHEVNFCFTCNQTITEDDLIENENCPVCGKEVPDLVDGVCPDCAAQKKKLLGMTKEELILMMMTQQMHQERPVTAVKETVVEEQDQKKIDTKKKEPAKKKESEHKEVIKEEVATASEEVVKSVEGATQPASADNSKVADISQVVAEDTDINLPPVTDEDILDQLDNIDVDGLGLSSTTDDSIDLPF